MNRNRTGAGAGGGRADGMAQTSPQHLRPMYPQVSNSRADRDADLRELMKAAARYYLDQSPSLTPRQKQLLRDIEKGRYQFRVLEQLLDIAPFAVNPMALSDMFRRATFERMPAQPQCIVDVTISETLAQAALDPWQMRLVTERTPTIVDATLDRVGPHLVQLERYRDVLLRQNLTNRRHFV